jgi:hypothetical protein
LLSYRLSYGEAANLTPGDRSVRSVLFLLRVFGFLLVRNIRVGQKDNIPQNAPEWSSKPCLVRYRG